ncbi:hypothetical protein [Rhizobium sp. 11_C7_N12_5]|uniref:hypothetical protein n=1 Tax=Rhizobium sp. 11_C7_N12_5 TaxID=3240770 RepID=UPI003F29D2CA
MGEIGDHHLLGGHDRNHLAKGSMRKKAKWWQMGAILRYSLILGLSTVPGGHFSVEINNTGSGAPWIRMASSSMFWSKVAAMPGLQSG